MRQLDEKVVLLEARVLELQEQLDEVIFFLQHAIKLRKAMDMGVDSSEIDRLLP